MSYTENMGDESFVRVINRLSEVSSDFRNWWMEADVAGRDDGRKEFLHPQYGAITYDYTMLRPVENYSIELIVFMPAKHH